MPGKGRGTGNGPSDESGGNKPYDLAERTALFGEAIIDFAKRVPRNVITRPLITQLVKAGTSVGANYGEADEAESKRDFRHKNTIVRKESRESKFWLRMIVKAEPSMADEARPLWQEAKELHLIFCRIVRSCDKGNDVDPVDEDDDDDEDEQDQ